MSAAIIAAPAPVGWPTLADDALHGLAGDVVRTLAPETEADPAGLLVSYLAAFGAALGGGPHVRVGGDRHGLRIFVVLVGETSRARKGSAWSMIRPVIERADPGIAVRELSGFGSGEAVVDAVRDPNPDDDDDRGAPDKRLLVIEPEFSRLLRVASRDGSTLSPIVRDAWDGVRLAVRLRSRTSVATGAHVVVLGHVVREELRRYLVDSDIAGGLANRFAFVAVRRARTLPSGGNLDDEVVDRLARRTRDALERARTLGRLHRSSEAEALWAAMYDELTADVFGLYGSVVARAEAQVLRLSVAYAALDGSRTIEAEHLGAAWELWRYCDTSARLIFGTATTGDPVADRLLAALRDAAPAGLDGTQQRAVFSRHVTGAQLDAARQLLEDRHLAETVDERTAGRPRRITFACAQSALGAESRDGDSLPALSALRAQRENPARSEVST